jgi:WD40 repeat protein
MGGEKLFAHSIGWSPDSKTVATNVSLWDPDTGKHLRSFQPSAHGFSVAWSPDGTKLASANFDGRVQVWDVATGFATLDLLGHTAPARWVCWNPDGTRLATGGWDHTIRIWDAKTGLQAFTLHGHDSWVMSVSWSPNGKQIASSDYEGTIKVWDASAGYVLSESLDE